MSTVIQVENLGKQYHLGEFNRQTLYEEIQSRWARWRGRPDPHALVTDDPRKAAHGSFWALRDVSFKIADGDIVGIIGRNGAGKSTLLKLLARITAPTVGRICIKGRIASLLEVGTGFHSDLTGRENIFLNGAILGMNHAEITRKLDEIVSFSGVEEFIDTPVKRYSSGMKVRLAFAVAAHLDPEILILDEVLAVGDASFQSKCLGKIGDLAGHGRTVLFVSHQMSAVEKLCRRGIVLGDGVVTFDGTQTDAIGHYLASLPSDQVSVAEREDHMGDGRIRVNAIRLQDARGNETATTASGASAELVFSFQRHREIDPREFVAVIKVWSALGVYVFTQSSKLSGDRFDAIPESGAIICRLEAIPLPAGSYRVGYSLQSVAGGVVYDGLENAFELRLEAGNFHGSGQLPSGRQPMCYVKGSWRLESAGVNNASGKAATATPSPAPTPGNLS